MSTWIPHHRGTDLPGPQPADDQAAPAAPTASTEPACCCPARPVVRVIMPPAKDRRHPVDLLLCGHHYRASLQALAAVNATVQELPGIPDDTAPFRVVPSPQTPVR
jgi:hypothetical protein